MIFFMQVENLMAVHPDYGSRVQALLDKYNAEAKKVKKQNCSVTPHYVIMPQYFIM